VSEFKPFQVLFCDDPRLAPFALDAREHCWVLVETHPDGRVARVVEWDGGEPEDQSFARDWSWVPDVLNQERAARDIEVDAMAVERGVARARLAAAEQKIDALRVEVDEEFNRGRLLGRADIDKYSDAIERIEATLGVRAQPMARTIAAVEAAVARIAALAASLDAANALLREALMYLDPGDFDEIAVRARIAAHLEKKP